MRHLLISPKFDLFANDENLEQMMFATRFEMK